MPKHVVRLWVSEALTFGYFVLKSSQKGEVVVKYSIMTSNPGGPEP